MPSSLLQSPWLTRASLYGEDVLFESDWSLLLSVTRLSLDPTNSDEKDAATSVCMCNLFCANTHIDRLSNLHLHL